MIRKLLFLYFIVLLPHVIWGQLTNFNLSVTKTDETCLGNGTLTFATSGTTAGSTVTFYVYKLPNQTTPVAVQTTTFLAGQTSGTYQVTAVQVLGPDQNSQSATITINSSIVPLSYYVTSTDAVCNNGTLTVHITSGVGAQYEIISGPVTRPLQPSPTFTLLPAGVYVVRTFDNCGNANVVTHTLLANPSNITIGPVSFPEPELSACNLITVSNLLSVGNNQSLIYPLELTYLIHFPNGSSQTIINILTSGLTTDEDAALEIPFFYDQLYSYDLIVKDGCGNIFTLNNNEIDLKLGVALIDQIAICGGYFLTVEAAYYMPGLQIVFTDAPPTFNPAAFNAQHPGPFPGPSFDYGNYNTPVPFGHYAIQVTDGCGHTAVSDITLIDQPSNPTHTPTPLPGCQSNISDVTIEIPRFIIVTAIITVAPAAYGPTPDDVSNQITGQGELVLPGLITGNYTVVMTDDCGNVYTYDFFVHDTATTISYGARPGCQIGKGSVRIRGNNTLLTSVIITSAPATFPHPLPYNASSYIGTAGDFSMQNLDPGSYSFAATDSCGLVNNVTIPVVGYAITSNDFTLTPHCGSFDISLSHNSNAVLETFWLQEFNPATNTWGNPVNGTPYVDGTDPNATNSYQIQNNTTTFNLTFLGVFRIIKSFQSFDDGTISPYKTCIEIVKEFVFDGLIQFTGIEKVNCNGNYMDVKLYAVGVPPLHYSIIEKNGLPFFVDNGTSNVFLNLLPAIYTFKVDQSCGDSRNFISDVAQLPSLAIAQQPNDMGACDDASNDGMELFTLTDQNADVLGGLNPTLYTITYHLTLNDASLNTNPLPSIYNSGNAEIFCRLKYNNSTDCFDVVSFHLMVHPHPGNQTTVSMCENQSVTLSPGNGFASYQWSTGQTGQSIVVNQDGQYTVNIVKVYPTATCSGQFIFNVVTVPAPIIDHLNIVDWTPNENSIEVILENNGSGNYEYSLDNITFQSSPVFNNLLVGYYTVYVRDSYCGGDTRNALLLNYPRFFTPNGDGINDYWKVQYSQYEPNMETYIYDRYGKLITSFTPESQGWDGNLNGNKLPSTDYWFVVVREDGRNLKGHFSMKR